MDHTQKNNGKQVVKSLEEWAAKILCRDNHYVQNLANADEEMKKRMLILSGLHQNNNDTKLQTNYICIFVIS